ncbi:MAG: hypothetical protein ACYCY5_03135 [Sulfuricella sp.]
MRTTAKILNWLALLVLLATFVMSFSKGKQLSYHVGTAISLLLIGAPFFLSLRALGKQASASAKSAITPNYIVAVLMVLIALYGVFAANSFAFVPLTMLLIVPTILNIRLLKSQVSSQQHENL